MSSRLMTALFYKAVILQGEIWSWLLLGCMRTDATTPNFVETYSASWEGLTTHKSVQTDPTLLRYTSATTEQKKCWDLLAGKFDCFQTLPNNWKKKEACCCLQSLHRKEALFLNRPFLSCPNPLLKIKTKGKALNWYENNNNNNNNNNNYYYYYYYYYFSKTGFAFSLVLKERVFEPWKWSIVNHERQWLWRFPNRELAFRLSF